MVAQYKNIPGFDGRYGISSSGEIYSHLTNKVLSIRMDSQKHYLIVDLHLPSGYKKTLYVHRLVALTYVDNPNNYSEVNHIDANKLNNDYINLEWCTHLENMRHMHTNGLRIPSRLFGEDNPRAKLTEQDVHTIRTRYKEGGKIAHIARDYIHLQEHTSKNPYKSAWAMISNVVKSGWTSLP